MQVNLDRFSGIPISGKQWNMNCLMNHVYSTSGSVDLANFPIRGIQGTKLFNQVIVHTWFIW